MEVVRATAAGTEKGRMAAMTTAVLPTARRRGGAVRVLIVTLVVLLALLVIADRVIAYAAASRISDDLHAQFHTNEKPEVTIEGFPLLTQAVAGSYERVRISGTGVDADQLDEVDVRLDLRQVRLPLKDAVSGNVSGATVGDARVEIDISEASLEHLTGLPITIDGITDEVARLTTTFEVLGQQVELSIDAMVVVQGTTAHLDVQGASAGGIDIPTYVVSQLSDAIGIEFEVPVLVDGMHLDEVTVRDGAVVLHASGSDVPMVSG